jgi:hypothetical protein
LSSCLKRSLPHSFHVIKCVLAGSWETCLFCSFLSLVFARCDSLFLLCVYHTVVSDGYWVTQKKATQLSLTTEEKNRTKSCLFSVIFSLIFSLVAGGDRILSCWPKWDSPCWKRSGQWWWRWHGEFDEWWGGRGICIIYARIASFTNFLLQ